MKYPITARTTAIHPVKLFNLADKTFIRLQIAIAEKDALKAENERLRAWGHAAYRWMNRYCPHSDAYYDAPDCVKGEHVTNG